ncbi:hypothetical protein LXA43DRAFT_746560 [Ganoderma leucocontextum]|nr:hypothetical protein LXA43DRAFT_746560 [Ganoderma leucocontextum]
MNHQPTKVPPEGSTDSSQHWRPVRQPSDTGDLCAQVHQRLPVLDPTEKATTKERSERAMAWNRTLPVNRLPNELLVSIFAEVADALSAGHSTFYIGRHHLRTKWMKLILVCRYWRDVAYASPKLWRVIHMRSPAHTERALALSSPATIDVSFGYSRPNLENIKLLQPHAHRLRSLNLNLDPACESAVIALFQGDGGMPALETLQLPPYGRKAGMKDVEFVDLQLTAERYPRLGSLTLAFTVAPQDIKVYTRLRNLSLRDCRCDFSFHHFLDVLDAATNLEGLRVDSILQRIKGDWAGSLATGRKPVCLRHLKSLELFHHPAVYTSRFLSHVLLSPIVSVWIVCDNDDALEEDVMETVAAMLPSDPAIVLPALALAKGAVVVADGSNYSLSCSVEPHSPEEDLIKLEIGSSLIADWSGYLAHGVHDLLNVLPSAPLTTLSFTGDCDDVTAETWTEIFTRYPLLDTLELVEAEFAETVFAGLMAATPPPDSPVPCPRLRSVSMVAPFFEEAIDVMLQCLRDRAGKGYYLEHVRISLQGQVYEDPLMETDYVPELEELVSGVEWEMAALTD